LDVLKQLARRYVSRGLRQALRNVTTEATIHRARVRHRRRRVLRPIANLAISAIK
jgi:hypothetical protein